MKQVVCRAPSNIALIKYMGKTDLERNLPCNGSLSLTLQDLCTWVELRVHDAESSQIVWVNNELPEHPLISQRELHSSLQLPVLGEAAIARAIRHLEKVIQSAPEILTRFGIAFHRPNRTRIEVRTANTFPTASGIASSASSFAALTLSAVALLSDLTIFRRVYAENVTFRRAIAELSRQGSGSSCRSFEGHWVSWEGESSAALLKTPMPEMADLVVLVASAPKQISSSEAHRLVQTSPLWSGRTSRAEVRLREVQAALAEADLGSIARIAWAEFWEMHSLFHTCAQPFTYWEPGSLLVLKALESWKNENPQSPPIVTMDAGPNVHVLVKKTDVESWREKLSPFGFPVLQDQQGLGAEILS